MVTPIFVLKVSTTSPNVVLCTSVVATSPQPSSEYVLPGWGGSGCLDVWCVINQSIWLFHLPLMTVVPHFFFCRSLLIRWTSMPDNSGSHQCVIHVSTLSLVVGLGSDWSSAITFCDLTILFIFLFTGVVDLPKISALHRHARPPRCSKAAVLGLHICLPTS